MDIFASRGDDGGCGDFFPLYYCEFVFYGIIGYNSCGSTKQNTFQYISVRISAAMGEIYANA